MIGLLIVVLLFMLVLFVDLVVSVYSINSVGKICLFSCYELFVFTCRLLFKLFNCVC